MDNLKKEQWITITVTALIGVNVIYHIFRELIKLTDPIIAFWVCTTINWVLFSALIGMYVSKVELNKRVGR